VVLVQTRDTHRLKREIEGVTSARHRKRRSMICFSPGRSASHSRRISRDRERRVGAQCARQFSCQPATSPRAHVAVRANAAVDSLQTVQRKQIIDLFSMARALVTTFKSSRFRRLRVAGLHQHPTEICLYFESFDWFRLAGTQDAQVLFRLQHVKRCR